MKVYKCDDGMLVDADIFVDSEMNTVPDDDPSAVHPEIRVEDINARLATLEADNERLTDRNRRQTTAIETLNMLNRGNSERAAELEAKLEYVEEEARRKVKRDEDFQRRVAIVFGHAAAKGGYTNED